MIHFAPFINQAEKIVTFLVMLSILVVLHELGHFLVARRNGVRVNEFAVGFGPKLLKWTSPRSGTVYAINMLPLGGYCAMQGEDGKNSEAEQKREFEASSDKVHADDNFQAKSTWQRLSIIVAGPVANFILAFVILLFSASVFGIPDDKNQPVIGPLIDGMPAQQAGLHAGDKILSLDGATVTSGQQVIDTIHNSLGKQLALTYERDGIKQSVKLTPVRGRDRSFDPKHPNFGYLGFMPVPTIKHIGFGEALTQSVAEMHGLWDQSVGGLVLLVSHPRVYGTQVTSIVGMARAAGAVQDFGPALYLQLAALISFTLGIFNLLPFPALDGGRGVFIIAEMLRGKPVDPEKEALVHVAGFALLMLVMIAVTYHDIANLLAGKGAL